MKKSRGTQKGTPKNSKGEKHKKKEKKKKKKKEPRRAQLVSQRKGAGDKHGSANDGDEKDKDVG